MAMGSQHLVGDFRLLSDLLEKYPQISIVTPEDQPSNTCDIEYSLPGYERKEDGSIGITSSHRVRISLPFGYPHFAPTVKPLSRIFHPDIDPAAVRIAGFWKNNPSLPDLVLHIGQMLCGGSYSLETPFNQEAADWYREKSSELPLASFPDNGMDEPDINLDALDDDFAALVLEDVTETASEPPPFPDTADSMVNSAQVDYINGLIADKKIFTASETLEKLKDTVQWDNTLSILLQTVSQQLNKAEEHYALAQQLEEIGKPDEALDILDRLFELAVDAPGAEMFRNRLTAAAALLPGKPNEKDSNIHKKDKRSEKREETSAQKKKGKKKSWSLPQLPRIPLTIILAIAVVTVLGAAAAKLFLQDTATLNNAQTALFNSRLLIEKKKYSDAQVQLKKILSELDDLTVLRFKKSAVEQEIEQLLGSKNFQEGLKGHELFKGAYYPAPTAKALQELDVLTKQAQKIKDQGQLSASLALYRQAHRLAVENALAERADEIEKTITLLDLQMALTLAQKAETSQDWKAAEETYRHALKLSGSLSDPETANLITSRLTAATFRHELDQSKDAFTKEQWADTIKKLEHAKELIDSDPNVVSPKERQDLNRLLVNARLYSKLSEAKNLYNSGSWDQAISLYSESLALLEAEAANFEGLLGDSIYKIKRIILMVRIAQVQEIVIKAENEKNSEEVISQSEKILQFIATSSISDDSTIIEIRDKVKLKIDEVRSQIAMDEKINWLLSNYKDIFRKYYPAFQRSELVSPKVTLLKEEGDKTVFTVTCVEKSKGSASRLELNYMHDQASDSWSIYRGN